MFGLGPGHVSIRSVQNPSVPIPPSQSCGVSVGQPYCLTYTTHYQPDGTPITVPSIVYPTNPANMTHPFFLTDQVFVSSIDSGVSGFTNETIPYGYQSQHSQSIPQQPHLSADSTQVDPIQQQTGLNLPQCFVESGSAPLDQHGCLMSAVRAPSRGMPCFMPTQPTCEFSARTDQSFTSPTAMSTSNSQLGLMPNESVAAFTCVPMPNHQQSVQPQPIIYYCLHPQAEQPTYPKGQSAPDQASQTSTDQAVLNTSTPNDPPKTRDVGYDLSGSDATTITGSANAANVRRRRRLTFINNILFKTELCKDYKKGTCPRGIDCQYAHGERELRHPRDHPLYHTTLCNSFRKNGKCNRGERCFHLHDDALLNDERVEKMSMGPNHSASASIGGGTMKMDVG